MITKTKAQFLDKLIYGEDVRVQRKMSGLIKHEEKINLGRESSPKRPIEDIVDFRDQGKKEQLSHEIQNQISILCQKIENSVLETLVFAQYIKDPHLGQII